MQRLERCWIGSGENIGALLPPHSTKCFRVTIG